MAASLVERWPRARPAQLGEQVEHPGQVDETSLGRYRRAHGRHSPGVDHPDRANLPRIDA